MVKVVHSSSEYITYCSRLLPVKKYYESFCPTNIKIWVSLKLSTQTLNQIVTVSVNPVDLRPPSLNKQLFPINSFNNPDQRLKCG